MGNRKKRDAGPQQHAEGQHGDKTHRRFVEQLHEPGTTQGEGNASDTVGPLAGQEGREVEGHHRLHQDREQHDEAEKNSEKVEAHREIERGR